MSSRTGVYAYYGDHRSGSTWIFNLLSAVCNVSGMRIIAFPQLEGHDRKARYLIVDTNAEMVHVPAISAERAFHVIRDPRDIVVSAYFSHKYSHPEGDWLIQQREFLRRAPLDEGIRASIDFRAAQFRRLDMWDYSQPGVYEGKFEHLIEYSLGEFTRIFKFLGILPDPLTEAALVEILADHSFERLSGGRRRGLEDDHHHYRRGTPGDWQRYFSPANKEYFKRSYAPLLIKLGYEIDDAW